jgi:hypothetical protein
MARKRKRKRGYAPASAQKVAQPHTAPIGRYGISALHIGHARHTRTQAHSLPFPQAQLDSLPADAEVQARLIGNFADVREARYTR